HLSRRGSARAAVRLCPARAALHRTLPVRPVQRPAGHTLYRPLSGRRAGIRGDALAAVHHRCLSGRGCRAGTALHHPARASATAATPAASRALVGAHTPGPGFRPTGGGGVLRCRPGAASRGALAVAWLADAAADLGRSWSAAI